MAAVVSVLIVDDRRAYAEALARRVGTELHSFETVGVAGADAAIELVRPHVVVLDLDGAGADGPALVAQACGAPCGASVVAITDGTDTGAMAAAVRAGARAIVLEHEPVEGLTRVLAAVAAGETHIPPATLTAVLGALLAVEEPSPEQQAVARLTDRERDVLELLVAGKRRAEVAATMFVSVNTVRTHTRNLLAKLGVHSSVEAVSVARRAGLGA
jgi:NarL family two-component system response regulator LiaR